MYTSSSPEKVRLTQRTPVLRCCCSDRHKDLAFVAGEKLRILDKSKSDWWLAANGSGDTGFVPSNFLARDPDVARYPWFQGKIPYVGGRADASELKSLS